MWEGEGITDRLLSCLCLGIVLYYAQGEMPTK